MSPANFAAGPKIIPGIYSGVVECKISV